MEAAVERPTAKQPPVAELLSSHGQFQRKGKYCRYFQGDKMKSTYSKLDDSSNLPFSFLTLAF